MNTGQAHETLVRVLDSLDAAVYVADITSYELLFVNAFTRQRFGSTVGEPCWKTLQAGQTGPCAFCTNKKLIGPSGAPTGVGRWEFVDSRSGRWYDIHDQAIPWPDRGLVRLAVATDITDRKLLEIKRAELIEELRSGALRGLLPICATCKRVREQDGSWTQIERYVKQRTEADFTHGYCPNCAERALSDL